MKDSASPAEGIGFPKRMAEIAKASSWSVPAERALGQPGVQDLVEAACS